ncbi:MAG: hypothetical protein IJ079_09665 [Lachnospiraceae bacterium]|nr:hypothetical protein [Lachnospiraceae bacterium]
MENSKVTRLVKVTGCILALTGLLTGCAAQLNGTPREGNTAEQTEEVSKQTSTDTQVIDTTLSDSSDVIQDDTAQEDADQDDAAQEDVVQADPYVGEYYEEVAGRAVMTISKDEGYTYLVTISWPDGYGTVYDYAIHGEFNGKAVMEYTDAVKSITIYDENGEPTVNEDGVPTPLIEYENGTGTIRATDLGIVWSENTDEGVWESTFHKAE